MFSQTVRLRLVTLFGISFVCRLALIKWPPTGYFYNIDELEMTLSCLDRFLGVPPTSLQWPGSLLQMLMLPVLGLDFLVRGTGPAGGGPLAARFASYISEAYANPLHTVTLLRVLVAAIASAATLFAFLIADALSDSEAVAWICAAVVTFVPAFARQSAMAMGEAAGLAFAFAAVFVTIRHRRFAFLAGFLFGAALAGRITIAGLIVLPMALLAFDGSVFLRQRLIRLIRFTGGAAFGFIFWCPFVLTEPIRFAKAVFGHLNAHTGLNAGAFVKAWYDGMGVSMSVLTVAAIVGAILTLRSRDAKLPMAAALIAACAVSLPLLKSGNDVFPRYFLPLLPCITVLIAVALRQRVVVALFAVGCAFMAAETVVAETRLRAPDEFAQGVEAARTQGGAYLYLPQEALCLYSVPLSPALYSRMMSRADSQLEDHSGLFRFLELRGIDRRSASVFLSDFTEDEQALTARLRAASLSAHESATALSFYYDPESIHGIIAERLTPADCTRAEAVEQFHRQSGSSILLRQPDPALGSPVWKGTHEWFLYRTP